MPPTQETLTVERSIDITSSLRRRQLLSFCYSACRIDGECLGWLPKMAYDQAHQQGRIAAVYNNDDLVGFALWSVDCGQLRCLQVWVRRDARLLLHGKALVDFLDATARQLRCHVLRLWCAIDLAANHFWKALGFRYRGWRWGRAKNSRRHALWSRSVNCPIADMRARQDDGPLELPEPPTLREFLQGQAPGVDTGSTPPPTLGTKTPTATLLLP